MFKNTKDTYEFIVVLDDRSIEYAHTLSEVRKIIKTEMPGVGSVFFQESAWGYVAVEGSKRYPTGDRLANIYLKQYAKHIC